MMSNPQDALIPRSVPTLYFVGVSTAHSSIMKVFPQWSKVLGIGAEIAGYDAPLHAPAEVYRAVVEHIRADPLSRGALVTTHKINLLEATRDLFDELDPYAKLCGEVSCISKRDGLLIGHAKDPITSGLAWQAFVPEGHWGATGGEVMCLGAGGAAVAISVFVSERPNAADRPKKFIAIDRSKSRLEHLEAIHRQLDGDITFEYVLNDNPRNNDEIMGSLPPGSIVINATGMGKDTPGSPITDQGIFPENGLVWELNYRGELDFSRQAKRQQQARSLSIEDGWVYFLHGWSQVIAEVFSVDLTPERLKKLDETASELRPE
jgi:shikimate 5-dehydrogenase